MADVKFSILVLLSLVIPVILQKCDERKDVVFLVDSSGSVTSRNFQKVRIFLADFIQKLDIGENKIRLSVVRFSSVLTKILWLNESFDKAEITKTIKTMRYNGGGTKTGEALSFANQKVLDVVNGDREEVADLVFVITDGKSKNPVQTQSKAKLLHDKGVDVVAIGVGSGVDVAELLNIASDKDFALRVDNFDQLKNETFHKMIFTAACTGLKPTTAITTTQLLQESSQIITSTEPFTESAEEISSTTSVTSVPTQQSTTVPAQPSSTTEQTQPSTTVPTQPSTTIPTQPSSTTEQTRPSTTVPTQPSVTTVQTQPSTAVPTQPPTTVPSLQSLSTTVRTQPSTTVPTFQPLSTTEQTQPSDDEKTKATTQSSFSIENATVSTFSDSLSTSEHVSRVPFDTIIERAQFTDIEQTISDVTTIEHTMSKQTTSGNIVTSDSSGPRTSDTTTSNFSDNTNQTLSDISDLNSANNSQNLLRDWKTVAGLTAFSGLVILASLGGMIWAVRRKKNSNSGEIKQYD